MLAATNTEPIIFSFLFPTYFHASCDIVYLNSHEHVLPRAWTAVRRLLRPFPSRLGGP